MSVNLNPRDCASPLAGLDRSPPFGPMSSARKSMTPTNAKSSRPNSTVPRASITTSRPSSTAPRASSQTPSSYTHSVDEMLFNLASSILTRGSSASSVDESVIDGDAALQYYAQQLAAQKTPKVSHIHLSRTATVAEHTQTSPLANQRNTPTFQTMLQVLEDTHTKLNSPTSNWKSSSATSHVLERRSSDLQSLKEETITEKPDQRKAARKVYDTYGKKLDEKSKEIRALAEKVDLSDLSILFGSRLVPKAPKESSSDFKTMEQIRKENLAELTPELMARLTRQPESSSAPVSQEKKPAEILKVPMEQSSPAKTMKQIREENLAELTPELMARLKGQSNSSSSGVVKKDERSLQDRYVNPIITKGENVTLSDEKNSQIRNAHNEKLDAIDRGMRNLAETASVFPSFYGLSYKAAQAEAPVGANRVVPEAQKESSSDSKTMEQIREENLAELTPELMARVLEIQSKMNQRFYGSK